MPVLNIHTADAKKLMSGLNKEEKAQVEQIMEYREKRRSNYVEAIDAVIRDRERGWMVCHGGTCEGAV